MADTKPTTEARSGTSAFLGAATIISLVSAGWLLLAPVMGHMGRPWPCVVAGVAILAGTTMAFRRPDQRSGWGLVVLIAAGFALLLGQGAVVPGLIGVIGGALLIAQAPGVR